MGANDIQFAGVVGEGEGKRRITILIDASVRFMNLGSTSPSSPAASSSAASHNDRTVPTS